MSSAFFTLRFAGLAENLDTDVLGTADRAWFRDAHFYVGELEFPQQQLCQVFGKRFDQKIPAFGNKINAALGNAFVIQGGINAVRAGGLACIHRHFQIEQQLLLNFSFPIEYADDAGHFQGF